MPRYRMVPAWIASEAERDAAAQAMADATRDLRLPWTTVKWLDSANSDIGRVFDRPQAIRGFTHAKLAVYVLVGQGPRATRETVLHEMRHRRQYKDEGGLTRGPLHSRLREKDANDYARSRL